MTLKNIVFELVRAIVICLLMSYFALSAAVSIYRSSAARGRSSAVGKLALFPEGTKVHFSCDFPESLKNDAVAGVEYWNAESGKKIFVVSDECGIIPTLKDSGVYLDFEPFINGDSYATTSSTTVSVSSDGKSRAIFSVVEFTTTWKIQKSDLRKSVSFHEFGHVIGLNHSLDSLCLMYPYLGKRDGGKKACDSEISTVVSWYKGK